MSFSSDVKAEICRLPISKKCCQLAEAYGILLYCTSFSPHEIRIITESAELAARLPKLFKRAFSLEFDAISLKQRPGKSTFVMDKPMKIKSILSAFGNDGDSGIAHHINFAVLEEECCRSSFLRGAFLSGGSVTSPEKRYHLELATSHFHVSREMEALMLDAGFLPKRTTRNANYVTYFKQSETIEDFLTTIGAPVAAMEVMNAKVEKHLRNRVNRRVNCDAANLDKVVDAAQSQLEAIARIEAGPGLSSLPEHLLQTALLRRENPELNLSQLAALSDPPVTKSCMSHRLRKLSEIAAGLT
jgi:DNA-binding protein WhiA